MTKERTAPQSPEDMAKAAQEAAVKAAMEQAQSMFGSIPGFQMPEGMQEQIMTQMTAGIPNMAEIQAQQEAMLKAAGIGMANAACEVFDALKWKNVVGTLSGDDTFLIVARSERDAKTICSELTRHIGQK